MLTRIYGTAWASKEELAAYLEALEMARQRDHRRLGRDLDLFSFHEEGPGFPFFHAKGMRLWNAIIDFWRDEHVKAGYEEVRTPQILRRELWEMSGHWENYKENMYFTEIDGQPFAVKPMNCPGGLLIYKSRRRSYRDLPLRMAELGQVHRHELSGVLHGLFRVRYFTQDDAHIYCTPEQLEDEVRGVLHFMLHIYAAFGFGDTDVRIELSTRGEKSIGSDEMWERAEGALRHVLESEGIDYQLNPGDAAFYGPKIDFHIRDVMGRSWQCGTIQVDFAMPERLDITYTGADNEEHRPVMIHRAMLGAIERFMGILLEHYGGNLPTWLAPVQALVLPVADRHAGYAVGVMEALRVAGLRAEVDDRSESVGKRIRDGQLQKVPYLLVVGDREEGARAVSVRARGEEKGSVPIEEFVRELREEVEERRLPGRGAAARRQSGSEALGEWPSGRDCQLRLRLQGAVTSAAAAARRSMAATVYRVYPWSSVALYNGATLLHFGLGTAGLIIAYDRWPALALAVGGAYLAFALGADVRDDAARRLPLVRVPDHERLALRLGDEHPLGAHRGDEAARRVPPPGQRHPLPQQPLSRLADRPHPAHGARADRQLRASSAWPCSSPSPCCSPSASSSSSSAPRARTARPRGAAPTRRRWGSGRAHRWRRGLPLPPAGPGAYVQAQTS